MLREAHAAGIPVIITDRGIVAEDESLYRAFIGSDFVKEGERAAEFLIRYYGNAKEEVRIIEIRGTENSAPALGRKSGFEDKISKYDQFNILRAMTVIL